MKNEMYLVLEYEHYTKYARFLQYLLPFFDKYGYGYLF